jgi:hypothetical protein
LDKRFSALEDRDVYVMASTFDPRFKLKWCSNEDERATPTPPTPVSELTPPPSKRPRIDDLLDFMSDDDNNNNIYLRLMTILYRPK